MANDTTAIRVTSKSDSGGAFGSFTVVAPLPPTLNQSYHSYPAGGHCRIVLSSAARAWKDEVAYHVRCFLASSGLYPDTRSAYSLQVTQYLAKNNRDADCSIKLAMDAIFNGMGVNDNRVFGIILDKVVDKGEAPRIAVVVNWHG